jgi:GAF domain-containing protein
VPEDRLRPLVEAGIALTSDLSVESVLRKLVDVAPAVIGAGRARFRQPESEPSDSDVLSVPILLRGAPYGYLDLVFEQEGHAFTSEEQELATLLAKQAAIAIENARRYESATRWLHQLEALTDIGNALTNELELSRLLQIVAHRLRELIAARLVVIALPTDGDDFDIAAADGELAAGLIGSRLPQAGSKAGRVLDRGRSERVDSLIDDIETYQPLARRIEARAALFVPMLVRERAIGILMAVNKVGDGRFSDDDLRLGEAFAARAAIAVDLSERLVRGAADRAAGTSAARPGGLTKREAEVLRLVAMGLSDAAVADRLVVSERTVHAHLRSIYRKLEVSSRSGATRYALEQRLV